VVISKKVLTFILPARFYLNLFCICVASFIFSSWQAWPIEVEPKDKFGLISHLPPLYWIGLMLLFTLTILITLDSGKKNYCWYLVILLLSGLYLFGPSVFMMAEPVHPFTYFPSAEVKLLLDYHHISPTEGYPLLAYRTWPGIHFISASLITITKIGLVTIIKYAPLIWTIIMILLGFYIGQHLKLKAQQTMLMSEIVLLSSWGFWVGYLPQGIAFLLYLTAVTYFFTSSYSTEDNIILLFVLIATTMIHALAGLVLLFSVVSISIYKRRWLTLSLSISVYIAWLVYYSVDSFSLGLRALFTTPFYDYFFTAHNIQTITSSIPRLLSRYSQIVFVAILVATMVISLYFFIKNKYEISHKNIRITCLVVITSILGTTIINYGGETLWRSFWYISLPAAIFITLSLKYQLIFPILLALLLPLHLLVHYLGYAGFEQVLTTELKGTAYLTQEVSPLPSISYFYTYSVGLVYYFDPNWITINTDRSWSWDPKRWEDPSRLEECTYILISRQSTAFMELSTGKDQFRTWMESIGIKTTNLIYSNGSFDIYDNHHTGG
jgi:hypothetical protein